MTLRPPIIALAVLLLPTASPAGWLQWGGNAQHESASSASSQPLGAIESSIVVDPFADRERDETGGDLFVHYPVPLIDGNDLFVVLKGGLFTGRGTWETQSWSIRRFEHSGGVLAERWTFRSSWKPVPTGPSFEPVYHCAVTADLVWSPGAGGTLQKIDRRDGSLLATINPFGTAIDPNIYVAGPLTVDETGNVFYNAVKLDHANPWTSDPPGSWLVGVARDGSTTKAAFADLTTTAPRAGDLCTAQFPRVVTPPLPPSPDAVAPTVRCGPQRPGLNVAPAVARDGTIYTMSRASFSDRNSFLVAVNPDLSPKWCASLRNRFSDGCNVAIPLNGTAGGCRSGARTGVDPTDNLPGSGRVVDDSTSSPVVAPDGSILYGAFTGYNYSQGHLMMFGPDGAYRGAYGWGWDLTPAIYRHDGTWSVLLKENHYSTGSYCDDPLVCPPDRTFTTPDDPEAYFITQLDPSLRREWRFQAVNTESCVPDAGGVLRCVADHPQGFEWCVNAIAVDRNGVVYANSEDGNLYAIGQGGTLRQNIFLRLAAGAAYTPLSLGDDGRVYTQNDGVRFIVKRSGRTRAIRK